MNYETQKEMIDTLNKVVTEQNQVITAQKEMIKNLCSIVVKKQTKPAGSIIAVVSLN